MIRLLSWAGRPVRLVRSVLRRGASLAGRWRLRARGAWVGEGVECIGRPIVSGSGRLRIGARTVLCSSASWTALGVSHPVILRTLRAEARIEIGEDCGLSGTSICAATSVQVGARCLIGADVIIADTDFHPLSVQGRRHAPIEAAACAPVVIEDDVFLGARSMVLKGVRIGAGAVVGAGSVVTRDVAPGTVVAGQPARPVGSVDSGGSSHVG